MAKWRQAYSVVRCAVRSKSLPKVGTQICADCGKPAQAYDHRDYNKPLDVVAVCTACNIKRGPAKPQTGYIGVGRHSPLSDTKKWPNSYFDLINKWPSISAMAADFDENYETVKKWRARNFIPADRWLHLIAVARRRRIRINAKRLIEMAAK